MDCSTLRKTASRIIITSLPKIIGASMVMWQLKEFAHLPCVYNASQIQCHRKHQALSRQSQVAQRLGGPSFFVFILLKQNSKGWGLGGLGRRPGGLALAHNRPILAWARQHRICWISGLTYFSIMRWNFPLGLTFEFTGTPIAWSEQMCHYMVQQSTLSPKEV